MDFTYPLSAIMAAVLAFIISLLALLVSVLGKRSVPRSYNIYIALLVVLFVTAMALRWSDWQNILLTSRGLLDLAIILAFATVGALVGTLPLWLFGKRRRGQQA